MGTPHANPWTEETAARLWQAVLDRSVEEDGRFVYAVHTTGVFCRPTCPSRRPRRKNVSFFSTPEAARAAGFRACKRCRPQERGAGNGAAAKVIEACRVMEAQPDRIPTLEELGRCVALSPTHLQRVFKRSVGISPRAYGDALRIERLKKQLQDGKGIAGALYEAGYGSSSRLYETAGAQLGMTPKAYRQKAIGERIGYATVACPLGGRLLVAATERGVCSVRLGDRDPDLEAELRREFKGATLAPADGELAGVLEALVEYLAGHRGLPDLPYDVVATAFQRRVWEAIRSIPEGSTATYSELARALGQPRAARAVARACARNPLALVIPCHRVVPKSGGTGGYRWGARRKAKLLHLEKTRA